MRPRAFAPAILWWIMDWKSMYIIYYFWVNHISSTYLSVSTFLQIYSSGDLSITRAQSTGLNSNQNVISEYSVVHARYWLLVRTTLQVEFRKSMVGLCTNFSCMDSRCAKGPCICEEAADGALRIEPEVYSDSLSWSVMVQVNSHGQSIFFFSVFRSKHRRKGSFLLQSKKWGKFCIWHTALWQHWFQTFIYISKLGKTSPYSLLLFACVCARVFV